MASEQSSSSAVIPTDRLVELKAILLNSHPKFRDSSLSVDGLLDSVVAIYDDVKNYSNPDRNPSITKYLQRFASLVEALRQIRLNKNDFAFVRRLAKGQFGEVSLVRGKYDNKVYAMKALRKSEMLKQAEIAFFMEERQVLASLESNWITALFAAFQDDTNLYLLMDYLPGGDLASLLMKADEGTVEVNEDFTRFYVAQIILALDDLHKANYIHRDLKPGNVLLDRRGHVKLADFGSCIQLDSNGQVTSTVTVGTPDYISPEVLRANEGKGTYGKEADFWSLGVTLYELLIGDTPFYAESLAETYHQIMNHEEHFGIPNDIKLSEEATSLLRSLLCDRSMRIKTAAELKAHPFFKSIDWNNLQTATAPFVPTLTSDDDVSNFYDVLDDETDVASPNVGSRTGHGRDRNFNPQHLPFVGYSFIRRGNLQDVLASQENKSMLQKSFSPMNDSALQVKLTLAETEIEKMKSKLALETKKISLMETAQSSLEEEIQTMRKTLAEEKRRVSEKEDLLGQIEKDKKMAQIELESSNKRLAKIQENQSRLEVSLADMEKAFQQEATNTQQFREQHRSMQEQRSRLEAELDEAKKRAQYQFEKISKLEDTIADLSRTKALTDLEIASMKSQIEDLSKQKEELEAAVADLEESANNEVSMRTLAEEALHDAQSIITKLKRDLLESLEKLNVENNEKSSLKAKISELESGKNHVELEIIALKRQLTDARSSSDVRPVSPTKSGFGNLFHREKSIDIKSMQDAESEKSRSLDATVIQLQLEKSTADHQVAEYRNKLFEAEKELNFVKKNMKFFEEKMQMGDKMKSSTINRRAKLSSAAEGSDADLSRLREESEIRQKMEKKINDLQKANAIMQVELTDLKGRYTEECTIRKELEGKYISLEAVYNEDSRNKSALEKKYGELEVARDALNRELFQAKMDAKRMSTIKSSQDGIIADQTRSIAILEMERGDLSQRYENLLSIKEGLELDLERSQQKINELLSSQIDPQEFANIAEECHRLHREFQNLTAKYGEMSTKYSLLAHENENLKGQRIPHDKEDEARDVQRSTLRIGDFGLRKLASTISTEDLELDGNKRTRFNISKMKALELKLNNEVAIRTSLESELLALKNEKAQLEQEIEEQRRMLKSPSGTSGDPLFRGLSISVPRRKLSSNSMRKLRPILFPENSDLPILQGQLKLRIIKNEKKNKYDWVKKFAVVRQSKLYLYDREKDKDTVNVEPIVDLRCDLFVVRKVKPKELIHLTTKEVSCVFTVQSVTSQYSSMVSLDNLASLTETATSLTKLEENSRMRLNVIIKSIEKEEKFKQATEKMMSASTGEIKRRTQAELDECIRRLRILRQEREEMESTITEEPADPKAVSTVYGGIPESSKFASTESLSKSTEAKVIVTEPEVRDQIEKKESFKRGVENMLGLMHKDEARANLNSQLFSLKKDIAELRSSLEQLDPVTSTVSLPKRMVQQQQIIEHQGHAFRIKSSLSSTTCYRCNDVLFGSNQTLECQTCHMMCHKFCMDSISVTCTEYQQLKMAMKWYFMAADEADRTRWVTGLDCVRNNIKDDMQPKAGSEGVDIDSLLGGYSE